MRGRSYPSVVQPAGAACFALIVWILFLPTAALAADQIAEVVVAVYEGVINPVAAEYVQDAILMAQERQAQALLIRLDTPGGLDTSMRLIIKDMTSATVPVIVYVSPSGGRAASAGVFITMAAHVAAMAPGTNIGAAHPVAMGGGEMDKTMREKVENDSAAYIKSLAEQRGRNAGWAENAVRKSVSATEKEAMKLKVIDLIADDVPALLKMVNGRTVTLATGPVTLRTNNSAIYDYPMSLRLNLLKTLSDPNIAYILMTVGTIGLMAELYNPGAILPGIVGAISLILAFYSFQSLPVNYAGLLLMALGILFFILEASVTSYGLLAIGGVISMLLGSLMLIKTDAEFYQLSWGVILPVIGLAAAFSLFIVGMGVKAMRRKTLTGTEEMVGLIGVAKTAVDPHGQLSIHGELWQAVSDQPLKPGDRAEVTKVEGLTLHVKPVLQKQEATL